MATILCVDDEPSVGVLLEHTLAKIGHRPLLVSSVEEAMQMVARTPLDLIIADYRMPKYRRPSRLLEKEGYRIPLIMTGIPASTRRHLPSTAPRSPDCRSA
jgi:CheY-like chemotaxis protein